MSKKKSKKSKNKHKNKGYYYESYTKKDGKKGKKGKKHNSFYDEPVMKTIKPTLDKKDAKASRKILMAPIDIPKDFRKNREKCNHAGNLISADEFKAMTPAYAAFTPMLDNMIAQFGEDRVHICQSCYDVLVDADAVDLDDMRAAVAVLYASVNRVVSGKRMKSDEVRKLSKLKSNLEEFNIVAELLVKAESRSSSNGGLNLAELNKAGNGGAYIP